MKSTLALLIALLLVGCGSGKRELEKARDQIDRIEKSASPDWKQHFKAADAKLTEHQIGEAVATAQRVAAYDRIRKADLAPVEEAVDKAGKDWPAKKDDLERRLAALKQAKENAATMVDTSSFTPDPNDLKAKCGQLYYAWDKILEDLEESHGEYKEKIKTVRSKDKQVSSDTQWTQVPAAGYHAVEKDLGMAIAHKDVGLYDSEANSVAQPPGYAYIAPPGSSNQYGYWHGSVWTWLPEYLIMRQMFWGHSYQPVYINEYNGYSSALRRGTSYYGQETPAAPPKFGTHGTFTQQNYASSRYVQSGTYKPSASAAPRPAPASSDPNGHRFGHSEESPPMGKRFGSPSSGRRFGGRRR